MALDPGGLFLQSARAKLAGPHAPDLLSDDEPCLLQDADVLLHAREGHVELLGKVRDRSVCTSESLQNAASGRVRERGERSIETGTRILNHDGMNYIGCMIDLQTVGVIGGAQEVRETIKVSGGDRSVKSVAVRVRRSNGSSSLVIRLEKSDGTVVEEVSVPASLIAQPAAGADHRNPS